MPKQPVLYEAMYILDAAMEDAQRQQAVETLENHVRQNGGEVVATREFGRRRLAYEIDGHLQGTYMILYFKGDGAVVEEVKHEMRLIDGLVRGIVVLANPKALFEPKEVVEAAAEEPAEGLAEAQAEAEAVAENVVAEEAPAAAPETASGVTEEVGTANEES